MEKLELSYRANMALDRIIELFNRGDQNGMVEEIHYIQQHNKSVAKELASSAREHIREMLNNCKQKEE